MISFKQNELDKGSAYFKKVHSLPHQKKLITDVAQVISKFAGIELIAMKGFLLMTIKEWQVANNLEFSEMAYMEEEPRIEAEVDLMKRLFDRLSRILRDQNDQQKLKDAIERSYEFYKIQFNREY
ncbi:MAG: hypothetical protein INQ03_10235 [Candidatus Heimdallarchaeota archaeon]|nr:hypothetical protein [Candidatus Heimdallarchaeota archaeon]